MISTAIKYLQSGLCVLPATRDEKQPDLSRWGGYQNRLPTEHQVRTWFQNATAMCVLCGRISGHLEILDFDGEAELLAPWQRLVEANVPGLMQRVVMQRTQSGGRHVIYRHVTPVSGNQKLAQRKIVTSSPEPRTIGGREYTPRRTGDHFQIIYALIETRGEGGLFLCDPTPNYELVQGSLCELPVLTEVERTALIDAARSLSDVPPSVSSGPTEVQGTGRPGDVFNASGDVRAVLQRHGWCQVKEGENEYWRRPGKEHGSSATLREGVFYVFSSNAAPFEPNQAYAPFAVYTLLEHQGDYGEAARELCEQGYTEDVMGDHSAVDLSGIFAQSATNDLCWQPDPGPIPESLLCVPGFINAVMTECLATAPYPNPVLAFCGALALQAFLAGRKVRDPGDNRTNLYLLGLAHSAAGKDWPRKLNTRILHEIGLIECLGERFASGEGVQDMLHVQPNILFQTDEMDEILQSINKAQDARYEMIMSTLLTLYSSANTVYPMRRKAGREPPGVIDQPCLTIFGTAIPTHYYQALSERMLTNGFFARMLILECGQRGAGQEPTIRELPVSVLETAQWWVDFKPSGGNLEGSHPKPRIVPHSDEAREILIAAREEADREYAKAEQRNDAVGTTVWGRVSEQSRKLGLLYAVSENHLEPEIAREAAEWAVSLVMHQTRRMLFMAQSHVSENPFHAQCLKVLHKLRDAPGKQLPHSVLLKRMKIDARSFQEIISTLEQRGDIKTETKPTGGRASCSYRLLEGEKTNAVSSNNRAED